MKKGTHFWIPFFSNRPGRVLQKLLAFETP